MGGAGEPWASEAQSSIAGSESLAAGITGEGGSVCVYRAASRRPPRLPVPPSTVFLGLGEDVSEAQVTSDTHTPVNWSQSYGQASGPWGQGRGRGPTTGVGEGKPPDLSSGNMEGKVSWLLTSRKENKLNVGSSGKPEGFANSASSPTAVPPQQPAGSSLFPLL